MNIAVIIAGGSGHRMGQDIPKQFINVYDKPVLIYTLEGFQEHPQIDAIEVVCIDGWHDVLRAYAKQFNITKLKWIVSGGASGQESIRNGVYNLEGKKKTFLFESELSARRMFADYAAKVPAIYSSVALWYEAGMSSRIISEFPSEINKEIVGEPAIKKKKKILLKRKED